MKLIHYILAASVILNVTLFVCTQPFAPRVPAAHAKTQARKHGTQTTPAPSLQTASPEQLTQLLAAMEFPPDIIRAAVRNRIWKIFNEKQGAILNFDNPRYWEVRIQDDAGIISMFRHMNKAQRIELLELQVEVLGKSMQKLKDAYGDPSQIEGQVKNMRRSYGDIPDMTDGQLLALGKMQSEYLDQIYALAKKRDEINIASLKNPTPTENEKTNMSSQQQQINEEIESLYRQWREDIMKTLPPDQLTEYDLRSSGASSRLGNDTKLLDVTEQEFRDMYAVYQKHYNIGDRYGGATSDFSTEQEFLTYRDVQLQQILGPDRYADFQQANNPAHEKLNLIVQRLDLPLSAAREVVSVQTDLARRAAAIDADTTLTNTERAEHYTALAQEAQARITQTLGERGYTAYRENSQNWIQTLESGTPPPTPAK